MARTQHCAIQHCRLGGDEIKGIAEALARRRSGERAISGSRLCAVGEPRVERHGKRVLRVGPSGLSVWVASVHFSKGVGVAMVRLGEVGC